MRLIGIHFWSLGPSDHMHAMTKKCYPYPILEGNGKKTEERKEKKMGGKCRVKGYVGSWWMCGTWSLYPILVKLQFSTSQFILFFQFILNNEQLIIDFDKLTWDYSVKI